MSLAESRGNLPRVFRLPCMWEQRRGGKEEKSVRERERERERERISKRLMERERSLNGSNHPINVLSFPNEFTLPPAEWDEQRRSKDEGAREREREGGKG